MKSLLVALVVFLFFSAVLSFDVSDEQKFKNFQKKYQKSYATEAEYQKRFEIFKKNLVWYAELDARSPYASFGVTQFSDLSQEEFREMYLMKNVTQLPGKLNPGEGAPVWKAPANMIADLPSSYTWQSKGAVTPVYNQGQCGSCWAFSATEAIESQYFLAGKINPIGSFSMEQIVQCDPYDYGCNGGWPYNAYKYIIGAKGIDSYSSYPYTSGDGVTGQCHVNPADFEGHISSWQWVTQSENEQQMQQFTYTTGPPSVCVDAASWSGYQGGVITSSECGDQIDHCVQIVGWNVVQGLNAWLVRNSWGTSWGYSGYLWVQMGEDTCGIASTVTSPIV
jgi:C1A family cysteine protease